MLNSQVVDFVNFLIEASLLIIIFSLLYYLFFRKLTFYHANRMLLLSVLVLSIVIPATDINIKSDRQNQFTEFVQGDFKDVFIAEEITPDYEVAEAGNEIFVGRSETQAAKNYIPGFQLDWYHLFLLIYVSGVFFMLFRLGNSIWKIVKLRRSGVAERLAGCQIIESNVPQSFSFFNWVFMEGGSRDADELAIIRKHELVHCKKLHSVDVILFEVVKSILWFHPGIYVLAKQSRLNNEYYTDHAVMIKEGIEVYSNTLFRQKEINNQPKASLLLVNSFALLSLKPRVMQLVKTRTNRKLGFSYLTLLPIVVMMFLVFSCNLHDEIGKSGRIESVRAYFQDEYGDQADRNGKLMIDIAFDIDGELVRDFEEPLYPGTATLPRLLSYFNMSTDLKIVEYGSDWPSVQSNHRERNANFWAFQPYMTKYQGSASLKVDTDGFEQWVTSSADGRSSQSGIAQKVALNDIGLWKTYWTKRRLGPYESFRGDLPKISPGVRDNEELAKIVAAAAKKPIIGEIEYQYNENGQLSRSYSERYNRVFSYNDRQQLSEVSIYKDEKIRTTYRISYSENGDEITTVKAYSSGNTLEYSVNYEYKYY